MDFEEYLVSELSKRYPGASISIVDVEKTNYSYRGIQIRNEEEMIVPTINIDEIREDMNNKDRSMDWAVNRIVDIYSDAIRQMPVVPEITREYVLANVSFHELNREKNISFLTDSPCREFEDLILVPYIDIAGTERESSMARVTNSLAASFNITPDELFKAAEANMKPVVKTLNEVIRSIMIDEGMPEEMFDEMVPTEEGMYICTNKEKLYGAGCVLFGNVLEDLAEKVGGDLYVFPSSVHETLIVPASKMSYEDAKEMVMSVNRETVAEKDFLSDNVYVYDAKLKEISLPGKNMEI